MQGQMYVPPLTKINKFIIIAYVGIFILSQILSSSIGRPVHQILMLAYGGELTPFMLLQLFTFPIVDNGLMTVVFNSLILWFIGSELEVKWGQRFYLKFLALATYTAGGIFALLMMTGLLPVGSALFGLSGTNLALLVAYGIIYSERTMIFMFIFPMKARYFCMLLAGIELFMAASGGSFNTAWGHIIAMATGFIYLKYQSLKAQGLGFKNIMDNHKSHQARKKRGNLRLVKTEEDEKHNPEDPKYWQ